LKFKKDWFNEGIYVATAFLLNSVLKSWFASEAARQLSEERRMGTLELLLSTPLTVKEILRGQWLALRRQFLGPLVVTLIAEAVMLLTPLDNLRVGDERGIWAGLWLAGMAMLVADLIALYWLGMWQGLAARNPKRAFSGTVNRILVLPWIGFAGFLLLLALATLRFQNAGDPGYLLLGVWVGLGLLADLGFGFWARHKLLTEFRVAAAQRYQTIPSLWKRLFSPDPIRRSPPPVAVAP